MNGGSYLALLQLVLPETVLAFATCLVLTLDLFLVRRTTLQTRLHTGVLVGVTGCIAAALLAYGSPAATLPVGMLALTPLTRMMQILLLGLTILTLLFTASIRFTDHIGEYIALILFATIATLFLVSTHNLLLIFISLEFLSLSLYLLTGFDKRRRHAAEAALKYFLFGGMSAGFLLFGFSLLYGVSNSLDLHEIATAAATPAPDSIFVIATVLVIIGFGFKIAAVPFHFWAPDVYQGAAAVSGGFIASSSKVASFFAFAQVVTLGLTATTGSATSPWVIVLLVLAAASMLLGNLAAIAQDSLRRLLAYSAIGHAGYMLLGIVAHTPQSLSALIYYVVTYALASLGAFGIFSAVESERIDSFSSLAGLSRRAPGLSFCMLIVLLSLAGIPPLSGFFAKFYIFGSALAAHARFSLLWLVLLAIATSAVSLYYYLRVLKQIYVADPPAGASRIRTPKTTSLAVWIIVILLVVLGCTPNLLLRWIDMAIGAIPQ